MAATSRIVRNGSRGMLWLEPLVEVDTGGGRVAYGPVDARRRRRPARRRAARRRRPPAAPRALPTTCPGCATSSGSPSPASASSTRSSLDDYRAPRRPGRPRAGRWRWPRRTSSTRSPTPACAAAAAPASRPASSGRPCSTRRATSKYVCCNADEGDCGTFADRMLMEGDPFTLIEGMTIAGVRRRRHRGLRLPPLGVPRRRRDRCAPRSTPRVRRRLARRGRPRLRARLRPRTCAWAPAPTSAARRPRCSRASRASAAMVRAKPPLPALEGLFGKPTVVNNVLTLATRAADPGRRRARPTPSSASGRSRGTQVFQLAGNIARRAASSRPRSASRCASWSSDSAAAPRRGRPVRAVQVGGPLGAYLPGRAARPAAGLRGLRRGRRDGRATAASWSSTTPSTWPRMARFAMEFCAEESCGKCTPCRIGSVRGVEVIDRIVAGDRPRRPTSSLLEDLCEVMTDGSLCAMGGLTPMPVRSALRHFPEDFADRRSGSHGGTRMSIAEGTRPRHPGPHRARPPSTVDDRRPAGHRARGHVGDAGRRRSPASTSPSCAPPTRWRRSARAGSAWSRSTGAKGTPASCTTPVRRRHGGAHPEPTSSARLRRGVMELYISDHPLDCLTCPPTATASCRTWPAWSGCARSATATTGANHLDAAKDTSNPYFTFDPASASSARAACGPATRCRAPSR